MLDKMLLPLSVCFNLTYSIVKHYNMGWWLLVAVTRFI